MNEVDYYQTELFDMIFYTEELDGKTLLEGYSFYDILLLNKEHLGRVFNKQGDVYINLN